VSWFPLLPTVAVTRVRSTPGPDVDGYQTWTTASTSTTAIEEPWKPDASPPRPDGQSAEATRLFRLPIEAAGVRSQGTASAARPDRIVAASGTWVVEEVVDAPAVGMVPRRWDAYCILATPEVTP